MSEYDNSGVCLDNVEELGIYRKNGKLNIKIEIDRNLSMLDLEESVENLIKSAKIELTEKEEIQIKQQILLAYSKAADK
jgi:hypothetical protein